VSDRVALVTGAAGAIGQAIAARLVRDGFCVMLTDKSAAVREVTESLRRSGATAESCVSDLSKGEEITALVDLVVRRFSRCDALVNNAGVHFFREGGKKFLIQETTIDNLQYTLNVNFVAPFLLARSLVPLMVQNRWGRIINITSRAGRTLTLGSGADYSATKAALIGFTRVLAEEVASYGITANSIAPGGAIASPMVDSMPQDARQKIVDSIPLKRAGRPEDVAAAVGYLVSEDASFVTGAQLDVNGGTFMG
jgi:3-oxoacyl-[acyl-carrier protein] reductase